MLRHLVLTLFLLCLPATAVAAPPCNAETFEQSLFTVCRFDSRHAALRLVLNDAHGTPLRSFSRLEGMLADRARSVRFAMNAGMFGTNGRPVGLYIENGHEGHALNRHSAVGGNFYLKPNGVFWLDADGSVHVETTETYATRTAIPDHATQSGPMLLIDGALHPQISANGPSKNLRNGVGIVDLRTAVFVISDDPVSFGRLARFFRDVIKCRNALYFDGAISSAWIPSTGRQDHHALLGPMVLVSEKP